MLNSTEAQISISAGLLHSFSEVTGYLVKIHNVMGEETEVEKYMKNQFKSSIQLLESLEKAEIETLKNWCKHATS